jgi:hypothetical protein
VTEPQPQPQTDDQRYAERTREEQEGARSGERLSRVATQRIPVIAPPGRPDGEVDPRG